MTMTKKYTFADKWSVPIERHGYTSLPNLLLSHQAELNITSGELTIICQLLSFKWTSSDPWPSVELLSKQTGMSPSTVRTHIRKLDKKGLVTRVFRKGATNEYNFRALQERLEIWAKNSKPPDRKRISDNRLTGRPPYQETDTKENPSEKDIRTKTHKKAGFKKISDILDSRQGGINGQA